MKYLFLIIAIALGYSSAIAHNPLTAKFELSANHSEGAILNVYLSQNGLHQALVKHYTEKDLSKTDANEYKKLAVQYLKKHCFIKADDTILKIGEGGIKLGNHQTDFKFIVDNYPADPKILEIDIDAFKENENHHSMFWWKNKEGRFKLVLSEMNNYKGSFDSSNKNALVMHEKLGICKLGLPIGALGVMLLIGLIILKRKFIYSIY